MYKIVFLPEVDGDISKLDVGVKMKVFKKLEQIALTPELGKDLGNKMGMDLSGLKKVYVDNKKIRIVYKIIKNEITVLVVSIGKRESEKVYREVVKRV